MVLLLLLSKAHGGCIAMELHTHQGVACNNGRVLLFPIRPSSYEGRPLRGPRMLAEMAVGALSLLVLRYRVGPVKVESCTVECCGTPRTPDFFGACMVINSHLLLYLPQYAIYRRGVVLLYRSSTCRHLGAFVRTSPHADQSTTPQGYHPASIHAATKKSPFSSYAGG
jgi:hypothetical protein